ncbi:5048_t:CDS:2 [Entrophospora sp. SA101]|nr:9639_t:CDS:2 [Entrophospora sp. SA101]CAJ0826381.1 5048_t:CDS:2 [Entrophospora sp. SA101]
MTQAQKINSTTVQRRGNDTQQSQVGGGETEVGTEISPNKLPNISSIDVRSINNPENNDNNDKSYGFIKAIRKHLSDLNPSLVLENRASVARDHLANERTFLAWLRTSLSFISIGIAITQLFRLNLNGKKSDDKVGKPLGLTFVVLGIIFLVIGIIRYFHSQYLMTQGNFPASRGSIIFVTAVTVVSLAACLVVILTMELDK